MPERTRTTTRRTARLGGAIAAALVASAALAGGAGAAQGTDAVCANALPLSFDPGFGLRPSATASTSGGERGRLLCAGTLYGHRITGPGTLAVDETAAAGCLSDHSEGTVTITLPTSGGAVHVAGALVGHRLGLLEVVDIAFPGARFHGVGPVVPIHGTCVGTPVTQALASITGVLRG